MSNNKAQILNQIQILWDHKKSEIPYSVIPAKAGIQFFQIITNFLDSGFHRSDDFLRDHQIPNFLNFDFEI